MAVKGRNFGSDGKDYENLRVDGNDLYWMDKKIHTAKWTIGEKLAAVGLVVTMIAGVIAALANLDKIWPNLCSIYTFEYCSSSATLPAKKE